jgi:hypothetical protein
MIGLRTPSQIGMIGLRTSIPARARLLRQRIGCCFGTSSAGYDISPLTVDEVERRLSELPAIVRAVSSMQDKDEAAKDGIELIRNGTEHPFTGKTVDGRDAHELAEHGVYVSAISGVPLFLSRHKVKGDGWPNFNKPIGA